MAKRMVNIVLPDYPFVSGDEVAVLVSGLGSDAGHGIICAL